MTQRPRKRNCKRMPRRLQYTFPTEHVPSYFQDWLTHRFWGHWGCQCQDQSSFEPHAKPRQNARYLEKTMYETIKQIGQKKTDGQVLPVPFEELELCGVCARWRGDQTVYPGGSKLWGEIVGEKTMKQFSSDICSREQFFQHMQFDSLRVELLFWWSPLIIPGKPMPDHAWSFANGFGQDSGGVQRCFRIWSPKHISRLNVIQKKQRIVFGQYTTSKLSYWLAPAGHPWADQGCGGRTQGTRDCVWAVENEEIQEVKRGMTPVKFEMWFSVIAQFFDVGGSGWKWHHFLSIS